MRIVNASKHTPPASNLQLWSVTERVCACLAQVLEELAARHILHEQVHALLVRKHCQPALAHSVLGDVEACPDVLNALVTGETPPPQDHTELLTAQH